MFFSRTNRPKTIPSDAGSKFATDYKMVYSNTGTKKLKKAGQTNIYEKIQASRESSKIDSIIRNAVLGDNTVLDQIKGEYTDATQFPASLREMQNTIIKAQNDFARLPANIRGKFDNDIDKFIHELGTADFYRKMGILKEVKESAESATEKAVAPAAESLL